MKKFGFYHWLVTLEITTGLLSGVVTTPLSAVAQEWREPSPILGTCTKEDTELFKKIPYREWRKTYNEKVASIVEGFMGTLSSDAFPPHREQEARSCTEVSSLPAPKELAELARQLDPWKDAQGTFGGSDAVPVLLEYLRVYECALAERSLLLPILVLNEERERREALPGGYSMNPFVWEQLWEMTYQQFREITAEMKIARPALERTLAFTGTMTLTATLQGDIECLAQASLQTRNALALSADTAACLPRIWNAQDPLHDPSACSDGRDNDDDGSIDLLDDGCSAPADTTE